MIFVMLIMVLFWGLIIVGIVFAIRAYQESYIRPGIQTVQTERKNTALEIVQERYAKGEIDSEEYEEKKRQLQAG